MAAFFLRFFGVVLSVCVGTASVAHSQPTVTSISPIDIDGNIIPTTIHPIHGTTVLPTIEEGDWVLLKLGLDQPATGTHVVRIVANEKIYDDRVISPVYFPAGTEKYAYFGVGETETTLHFAAPQNNHLDNFTEVEFTVHPYLGVNVNAGPVKVRIQDTADTVTLAFTATKPFYYEGEGHVELVAELIEGEFVNYEFPFVLVNQEGSATRHNDYDDDDASGRWVFPAGFNTRATTKIGIVDSDSVEDQESFAIQIFRNAITDQIRARCRRLPSSPITGCSGQNTIEITIKDDDVASFVLSSVKGSTTDPLVPDRYIAPEEEIKAYVNLYESGDCVIPFPFIVNLRAHGATHVLSKTEEEGLRFAPCVSAMPTDDTELLFPVKPATELTPGIYDINFRIEFAAGTDSRFYPVQSHWPVRVCVPGDGVDCTTYVPPPPPTQTTPPQVIPSARNPPPTTQSRPPSTQSRPPSTQSGGNGGGTARPAAEPEGLLENPGPNSFQSGIGVISGWVCDAERVDIRINQDRFQAAYGTERLDTAAVCGDADNGFGLLVNWNGYGEGRHTVRVYVDGRVMSRSAFTVTTFGEEFVRDAVGECVVEGFPSAQESAVLVWQQNQQNFVIVDAPADWTGEGMSSAEGVLENPGPNTYQSGIGVISGWVCDATRVEVALNDDAPLLAAYGTDRLDTASVCGDTNNGFGLLFNWNQLGDGEHVAVAYADGVRIAESVFWVTTLGEEFVRGAVGECVVEDFPGLDQLVTLEWQQNSQNFVITDVE